MAGSPREQSLAIMSTGAGPAKLASCPDCGWDNSVPTPASVWHGIPETHVEPRVDAGTNFIPELLGIGNASRTPYDELFAR